MTMSAVNPIPRIHPERKTCLIEIMTVSLNSQRKGVRQIEMEKNAEDSKTIPQERTIAGITNNHHGTMVGSLLDDPNLSQRAVLRRSGHVLASLWISRRGDCGTVDQYATIVPYCELRLQIER